MIVGVLAIGAMILAIALAMRSFDEELPATVQRERDRLMIEADRKIRHGLAELATRYPQVREAMEEFARYEADVHARRDERRSAHPSIVILLGQPPAPRRASNASPETLDASRFGIHIQLVTHRRWPPQRAGLPFGTVHVFPNLHLGSYARMFYAAVDPQLDRELKQLIDDALAPLAALDAEAGFRQAESWSARNKYRQ
jgi:hypothetical protein